MLEKLAALGRFGLFGFRMLGAIRLSAPQFRDTVRQIYVIGARSLPIIAVGGAFVGLDEIMSKSHSYGFISTSKDDNQNIRDRQTQRNAARQLVLRRQRRGEAHR